MAVLDADPALIILGDDIEPGPVDEIVALIRRVTAAPILVLLSGDTPEEDWLDRGADYCLSRPISVTDLVIRARSLLRDRGDAAPASGRPGAIGLVDPSPMAMLRAIVGDDASNDRWVA